ncbi:cobalamin biosynthesis protein [Mycobacterium branderi]|uniref:Cobalamin biosynthesis protein CobD n=1 Tax=Mycobacterium branderi TaxID=43348 RepID=A0A7I7W721_9MYCO|nr:cobalamin biosynthesis protein [Mycobacterium branderi]MCV7234530.1 cobalamin biosynthesis protein [Mycobacterium branderi]ORA34056.1 cobalamin biosynthesis protein [Mycobacterium branderi]BBZ13379.1 cobalamin biosynthesis protein CobD [Mycobacterium branderi]
MFGRTRLVGVLAGYLADLVLGDPRRGHPVAGFGAMAAALERFTYRDSRAAGALHVGMLVGALGLFGVTVQRCAGRRGPLWSVAVTGAATWISLGGTSLARTGSAMAELLSRDDIDGARRLVPSLCGRDPELLDAAGLARAAVESVAENTSDAQVAPLLWAVVGGVPGVLVYRGINTLDSMIGHRSPHYNRFGWAAARLDDAVNYVAARVTAALIALCAPAVGGSPSGALRVWRRDAARHPSPNAGVVEAAFAGALGIRLGGPTQYHYGLQIRPTLGDGQVPTVADLRRAVRLSLAAQLAVLAVVIAAARTGR